MAFVLCALAGASIASACFSERGDPVSLPADCAFAVDPSLIGTTHTIVAIRGFDFEPSEVRIPAGTTVTWVNCEPPGTDAHTSTADDQRWGSPLLERGESFSREFDAPGSFSYHCAPHPGMRGTVIVE